MRQMSKAVEVASGGQARRRSALPFRLKTVNFRAMRCPFCDAEKESLQGDRLADLRGGQGGPAAARVR